MTIRCRRGSVCRLGGLGRLKGPGMTVRGPAAAVSPPRAAAGAAPRQAGAAARILVTLGALLAYRVGTFIPLPGLDPAYLDNLLRGGPGGSLDVLGGASHRVAILSIGLAPYIASLLFVHVVGSLLRKPDPRTMNRWARYLAIVMAVLQSYGVAIGIEGSGVVDDPGIGLRLSTVATLTGGTVFLMWLADVITVHGIGHGVVLIITSGILAALPVTIANFVAFARIGAIDTPEVAVAVLAVIAVTALVAVVEGARRHLAVAPGRERALRLNGAGVAAPVYVFFSTRGHGPIVVDVALMMFFAVMCTRLARVANDAAITRQKVLDVFAGPTDGTPGDPGTAPADTGASIAAVELRLAVAGGVCLAAACAVPDLVLATGSLPLQLGGSGLLMIVIGALDTLASARRLFVAAADP